jgi:hypothetical protein
MGADASWRDVPKTCSLHIGISAFAVFGDEAGDPHLSTADLRRAVKRLPEAAADRTAEATDRGLRHYQAVGGKKIYSSNLR